MWLLGHEFILLLTLKVKQGNRKKKPLSVGNLSR